MFKVIYTKVLEHADEVDAKSFEFTSKIDAFAEFKCGVKQAITELLDNSALHGNISIHHHKACISIEGERICIAVVDDMNKPVII